MVVILAIAGITGGLAYYKYSEIQVASAQSANAPEPMESVASVRARRGEWSATTRAIGTIVALRQLEVRNEIAGTISELGFNSGDMIEAGTLLVRFDTRQEEAALAAAEADARLAKLTLERREGLRGSAAFSIQEYDKSREEYAAAAARAASLAVTVDKKRIVAPFRARVGITNLQPGAYLDVGTLIVKLQGVDSDAYVDFALPQDNAAIIRPGTVVTLSGAGIPGGSTTAKIIAEDNAADDGNRTIRFRARAVGFGDILRPGTFVDVTAVTSEPKPTILVPLASLRRSPSGQHVFVLAEDNGKLRARMREVATGPVQGEEIAIIKGLDEGELIAAFGSFKLREGLLVQTEAASPGIGVN
jgi:membrane fusion protein (multidrug efflux system)